MVEPPTGRTPHSRRFQHAYTMTWDALVFLHLPTAATVVAVGGLGFTAAFVAARGRPAPFQRLARRLAIAIVAWDIVAAAGHASVGNNLVHMFWTVQVPLLSMFLMSGPFLASTWTDDIAEEMDVDSPALGWDRGPWPFFLLTWVWVFLPLVFLHANPPPWRWRPLSDSPSRDVVQICAWGFGGELPSVLVPIAEEGFVRGVGFPTRDVAVELVVLQTAAWTTLGFTLIAFALRVVKSRTLRFLLCHTLPPLLGVLTWFVHTPIGILDPCLFGPSSAFDSEIWHSDVSSMRSLGGLVLVAGLGIVGLTLVRRIDRRRHGVRATPSTKSTSPDTC